VNYPTLPRLTVEFSLFDSAGEVRCDYRAKLTDSEIDRVVLYQVAILLPDGEWDEVPCDPISMTRSINLRFLNDDSVWFYDRSLMRWRESEFGDLCRRVMQCN